MKKWKERKPDPDGYYCWLIGKGYSSAKALKMVDAKFNKQDKKDKDLGWAWKGK